MSGHHPWKDIKHKGEPTDKKVVAVHNGITLYSSKGGNFGLRLGSSPDLIIANGHDITAEAETQGWYDLDNLDD